MTKAQWYTTLVGWLPDWWTVSGEDEAVLWGMAAVLEKLEASMGEHAAQTFILQAETGYLDEHGGERNLSRLIGELNPAFADRIRNIVNTANRPALKALVDALLDVGESTIVEDYESSTFFNTEDFMNRGEVLITAIYNAFSIIVDNQVHAPYSFFTREDFCDREDFIGTNESSLELFQQIVEAVNAAKALGTVYRLIERVA
jgi:hypothetical protein